MSEVGYSDGGWKNTNGSSVDFGGVFKKVERVETPARCTTKVGQQVWCCDGVLLLLLAC